MPCNVFYPGEVRFNNATNFPHQETANTTTTYSTNELALVPVEAEPYPEPDPDPEPESEGEDEYKPEHEPVTPQKRERDATPRVNCLS